MPVEPDESVRKDVYYPDDVLDVDGFTLRDRHAYWDADDDEDADELPDGANHGLWLPVNPMVDATDEAWLSAPRALREQLLEADLEEGDSFRILEMEKGQQDHDPYEVSVEAPYQS